jgi:hypothetical protein
MTKVAYDPTKVSVSINLVGVTGFGDGDICSAEFNTDRVSTHIGTGGEGRFIISKDASGEFMVRLSDYSSANAAMSILDTVGVPVAITVTDKTSNADVFFTEAAMIKKVPNFVKGAEAKVNEWIFKFIRATVVHSGAAEIAV